jgi:hypothetical protein
MLYYEDETPLYGASSTYEYPTSSACLPSSGPGGGTGTLPNPDLVITDSSGLDEVVPVAVTNLYQASTCSPSAAEKEFLSTLTGIHPGYGGSQPNASGNDVSSGGVGGDHTPYVSQFGFTMPSTLPSGDYSATIHVWDGDSNQDQYSWDFSVSGPTLSITKTVALPSVTLDDAPGADLYTLTPSVSGYVVAGTKFAVTDDLADYAGLTYSVYSSGDASCGISSDVLKCSQTIATAGSDPSLSPIEVLVNVAADTAPGTVYNGGDSDTSTSTVTSLSSTGSSTAYSNTVHFVISDASNL